MRLWGIAAAVLALAAALGLSLARGVEVTEGAAEVRPFPLVPEMEAASLEGGRGTL